MIVASFSSREPDPAIKEPLCAIIHAAPRIELREMHALREMLMAKYGREFAVAAMENTDDCVSERVTSRLRVETPSKELVDMCVCWIKCYTIVLLTDSLRARHSMLTHRYISESELASACFAQCTI